MTRPVRNNLVGDRGALAGAEIEWLRVSCAFADASLFACVWRYNGAGRSAGLTSAYAVTPTTAASAVPRRRATWVDPALLGSTRLELERLLLGRSDPLLESLLEVTAPDRIFAPFRLADGTSVFDASDDGLIARVGGCHFEHRADCLALNVDDEGVCVRIVIDLSRGTPMCDAFSVDACHFRSWTIAGGIAQGTLEAGRTHARLGTAWADHAGGDWYRAQAGRPVHPRWRRFSISLDDGRALQVLAPLSAGSRRGQPDDCDGHFGATGQGVVAVEGTVAPVGFSVSPRTHNRYEHGWTLTVPAIDAALEIAPCHEDHEVNVFLLDRGVMETTCQVRGTLAGARCHGTGFVEVFGEAPDINEFFWGQQKTQVAEQLERFMPRTGDASWLQRITGSDRPLSVDAHAVEEAIVAPIWSMMDRGGKGWRSVWLMTCCHALGFDSDARMRELLPIVEMLHTGSLVIDDIQDGATTRRGRPSLHLEIGTDRAINVGCLLYFLPLIIVQEAGWLSESQRLRIYEIVLRAMRQGHLGQGLDLTLAQGRSDLETKLADVPAMRRELVEQYRLKSGGQLEAIARIAGVLSGAPESWTEAVARYSSTFGVVFQIVDDLIDLCESGEKLGKEPGEDIRNGKLDYLLLEAYEAAGARDRRELIDALTGGRDGIERVRRIVQRTGAADRCVDAAEAMCDEAWRGLAVLPPTDAKIVMRSVPRWLLAERRRLVGAACP